MIGGAKAKIMSIFKKQQQQQQKKKKKKKKKTEPRIRVKPVSVNNVYGGLKRPKKWKVNTSNQKIK